MCNPRRLTVTATRDLAEAWQREVSRTVALAEAVGGTARLRQPLADRLGIPALRALEARLAGGAAGWQAVADGYRYEVTGGYVLYRLDEQALEIVATLADIVQAEGSAGTVITGQLRETLMASAEQFYYEDGHAIRNEAAARAEAGSEVRRQLDNAARERLAQAQQQAEAAVTDQLQAQAQATARAELARVAAARQVELAEQARQHLQTVGVRCRQAFNHLLAQAYRDAILAYAHRHGAEGIQCREDEGVLEIEFLVDR